MCDLCREARKVSFAEALQLVGERLKSENSIPARNHLLNLLDDLEPLDSPEEDPELAAEYYRRTRE